jgi:hypothetical protein
MSKTQEQLDEELMMSLLPTIDDMFSRMFTRSVCEAEDAELIEDFEDVVDEEESDDDEE